jgi:uncharacterized protein
VKTLKDILFLILGIAIITWSFYTFLQKPAPAHYQNLYQGQKSEKSNTPSIKIGDKSIRVEVADTDAERAQGLSGREMLETDTGLLFIFEIPGKYGFWMKDMKFPIDIVWIDENWQVISINANVSPQTFPNVFEPISLVKYALEINSGDASRLGIDIGSSLSFVDRI